MVIVGVHVRTYFADVGSIDLPNLAGLIQPNANQQKSHAVGRHVITVLTNDSQWQRTEQLHRM